MSSSKKRYDAEFKLEAVRLADNSEKGDSAIERELGLYHGRQMDVRSNDLWTF
jgi:transposase-like protein